MTNSKKGKLYLIPTTLGECNVEDVLPNAISRTIDFVDYFIVENEKTARKSIKASNPKKIQADLKLFTLNKHTLISEHNKMIQPCLEGKNVGLLCKSIFSFFQSATFLVFINSVGNVMSQATQSNVLGCKQVSISSNILLFR